jgi:PPOX class probable F420-dependent enzyme
VTDNLLTLLAARNIGVLATLRRDGSPQLSSVNHTFDPGTMLLRVSSVDGLAKTHNLRRDPRASFHAGSEDGWSYAVADGTVELTPVARDPYDAVVEELVDVYRAIRGDHPDWDDYRAAMVADRRLVLRMRVARVYGRA